MYLFLIYLCTYSVCGDESGGVVIRGDRKDDGVFDLAFRAVGNFQFQSLVPCGTLSDFHDRPEHQRIRIEELTLLHWICACGNRKHFVTDASVCWTTTGRIDTFGVSIRGRDSVNNKKQIV